MIKKRFFILSVLIIPVLITIIFKEDLIPAKEGDIYSLELFTSGNGWGYKIFKNGNVLIYQPVIPAVDGYKMFRDKHSAKIVGNLVIRKLENKLIPVITKNDLENLCIEGI